MPAPELIHIVIHIFEVVGLFVIGSMFRRAVETSPRKAVNELLAAMTEFEARLDSNDGKWKKLNANYALLLAREKSNGTAPEPESEGDFAMRSNETPAEWKARMRAQIASGGLKHK